MKDIRQLQGKNYLVTLEVDGDALVEAIFPQDTALVENEQELFWGEDGPQGEPGCPENMVVVDEEREQE